MEKHRKAIVALSVILIFLVILAYWGPGLMESRFPQEHLPKEVEGLELESELEGNDAMAMVRKTHLGQLKEAKGAIIGFYQEELSIWITEYDNQKFALKETERMAGAIKKIAGGFTPPARTKLAGQNVYRTRSGNIYHYFWVKDNCILYIVPGPLSSPEIGRLILELNNSFD